MRIFQLNLIVHQAIPNLLALRLMGCRTVTRSVWWRSQGSLGRSELFVTDIYIFIVFLENYCEYSVLVLKGKIIYSNL